MTRKKAGKATAEGTVPVALRVPVPMLKTIDDLATGGRVPATRTAVMLTALALGLESLGSKKKGGRS
jgi:hypothetical protein